MSRALSLLSLMAGPLLLAVGGCRHTGEEVALPGGVTPPSFRVRPAPDGRAAMTVPAAVSAGPGNWSREVAPATLPRPPVREERPVESPRALVSAIDFSPAPPPRPVPVRIERPVGRAASEQQSPPAPHRVAVCH